MTSPASPAPSSISASVEELKALFGVSTTQEGLLAAWRPTLTPHLTDLAQRLSQELDATPLTREWRIRGGAPLLKGVEEFLNELIQGVFDTPYADNRLGLGRFLAARHVPLALPMAAAARLVALLHDTCQSLPSPKLTTGQAAPVPDWRRLLQWELHLVAEGMLQGAVAPQQQARRDAEAKAAALEHRLEERTRELLRLTSLDPETGLCIPALFQDHLRQELARSSRIHDPVTVVLFDLNNFGQWLQSRQPEDGARILAIVGDVVRQTFRESDIGCRHGDDEFAVLMPRATAEQAMEVCRRLIKNFKKRPVDGMSFSLGVAQAGPKDYPSPESLLVGAETALTSARHHARKEPGFYIRRASRTASGG
ncbi:MAG: GGDEF domain-containing protein [Magnetococcales bacterium]|nr:GGDEF domain-containing protein [Magnetococcales bacterium]